MTKSSWLIGGLAATVVAAFIACSSSSSNPNGSNGSNSCTYDLAQELQVAAGAGSTCASCIQSSCSSQVSAYEGSGGCGAYFSCVCPGGTATTNQTTIEGCASQQTSACTSSEQTFSTCIDSNCSGPCKTTSSSGSGSSSGGGSGSSSGSSSGGGSGSSSGGSNTNYCSDPSNNLCVYGPCTTSTGTLVATCPTANLIGCCSSTANAGAATQECYYGAPDFEGEDAGVLDQQCTAAGTGTWSTTPPSPP